ncbi:flagellar biosynthesis protein FlgJ [Jannaschia seohaensis]|uniref:Rod binding protein n=1 Tax=Jannaschia seohaensis TaxID=475081 RepID=A0A2Y9B1D9_9RHOB|nr:flagellar biosynthesis protein FlgJ [Jannaschia seohaensis]PWJ14481.1 hypothetical protein BCF38_112104 [Jannaschia seohaensis]SSA50236.1 hypothetical protein SAMN05421539_112104 [Jannaschia seohaensis]
MIPIDPLAASAPSSQAREQAVLAQARQLEALLFAQMLKASGAAQPGMSGQGSPFEGFLQTAQAEAVASAGQTGLAEAIAASLMRRAG